jgi:drug/metabolite transporter (DMT)-like permease
MFKNKLTSHAVHPFLADFALLFGAFSWGIIWYPYRLLNEAGINGLVSSFYTYAAAVLIAGVFCLNKLKQWPTISPMVFILSMVAGWTNVAYVLAMLDGEVMRVMLLFYLSPIWTMLLAHFWLKERTTLKSVLVILVALVGALLMLFDFSKSFTLSTWQTFLPIPSKHWEWLALSSGFGFALTNVMTRKASHLSIKTKSFAVWLGGGFMSVIIILFLNVQLPAPNIFSSYQWQLIFIIALLLMAATVLVQFGVTQVPAMRASVLFLFELVVAAVAAYYLTDETMQWNEWLGGALIVLAGFLTVQKTSEVEH